MADRSGTPARPAAPSRRRLAWSFAVVAVIASPGVVLRVAGVEVAPLTGIALFGAAIVAAAFALAWAGEAAESEISSALAVGILAVIAILPEYAVDLYFAYASGTEPALASFAAANMTGSNRLLLGVGWPIVVLVCFLVWRRARRRRHPVDPGIVARPFAVRLGRGNELELGLLLVASALTLVIALTGQIHVVLGVCLIALFVWYLYRASLGAPAHVEHAGVALAISRLARRPRRALLIAVFAIAATAILLCAEPFADSLVQGGGALGVDDFLLVQWLAPLASESPEFIVALLFAVRGRGGLALAMLLASKVNQWTALVGSLPVAHLIGGGGWALPMDGRQVEEFLLTIAQTLMGVAILLGLRLSGRWAIGLFALFALTFVFPTTEARLVVAAVYAAIAAVAFVVNRQHLLPALRAPFGAVDSAHAGASHSPPS